MCPIDSSALSVGAERVAQAIRAEAERRGVPIELVRNGSRGLFWLEPLVEVETPAGRIAYGPVQPAGRAGPVRCRVPERPAASSGSRADRPYPLSGRSGAPDLRPRGSDRPVEPGRLPGQRRFRRAGAGHRRCPARRSIQEVTDSGLRGRGGAAFPTGIKWATVRSAAGAQKYVVCNADEGDSGTFSDRMLMEGDPYCLIEGMTIAALAVGATQGYIYTRSEYPHACRTLQTPSTGRARPAIWAPDVLGSGRAFDLEVRMGAGAYICGEETSMLESLEGKPGLVRFKPPLPAIAGLFGRPTVINNVMSLASVPIILARGAAFYRDYGVGRSHGTLPFQLAGNIRHGGLVEKAFGLTLRRCSTITAAVPPAAGRSARCRSAGRSGPMSRSPSSTCPWTTRPTARMGAMIGHGGIVAFDDTRRYGAHGALCDGVLRHRILRQMHPLPDRLPPRGGGDRPHHRRPGAAAESGPARVAVRHPVEWLTLRPGRHGALSGAVGAAAFPGGLRDGRSVEATDAWQCFSKSAAR